MNLTENDLEKLDYLDIREEEASLLEYLNEGKDNKKKVGISKAIDKGSEKVSEMITDTKNLAKSLYTLKDDDFTNKRLFPILTKFIARMTVIATAAVAASVLFNPLIGVFTAVVGKVTDHYIKLNSEVKQRERLHDYYQDKIAYLDDKIQNAETPEQRYKLNKMKTSLKNNLRKVNIFDPKGR